nr:transposase [Bifidobacterium longum]
MEHKQRQGACPRHCRRSGSSGWRSGCPPWTPRAGRSTSTRPGHRKRELPVRRRLPGRAEHQGSRGVQRREHGRRDPCEPGRRARRGPRAPLDGRARRVRGRAPAHGPRVREGFHPTASRVVRPDAGRNPKRNRTAPWDYDRKAHKGRNMVERVFNRMKHHRKAATRHDRLDETFLANLQLIPIAIYLKNTAKNPISVNTP